MVYINLRKADDKVLRKVLRRCWEARGKPMAYIMMVTNIYYSSKMWDRIIRGYLENVPVEIMLH